MAEQLHFETVNQLRQGYIARYERVQQAIHATRSATFEVTSNQLQQGQSAALSRVHMYMQQYAKVAAANPLHPESSAAIDALMHNHGKSCNLFNDYKGY